MLLFSLLFFNFSFTLFPHHVFPSSRVISRNLKLGDIEKCLVWCKHAQMLIYSKKHKKNIKIQKTKGGGGGVKISLPLGLIGYIAFVPVGVCYSL